LQFCSKYGIIKHPKKPHVRGRGGQYEKEDHNDVMLDAVLANAVCFDHASGQRVYV
jgi:hypothetical protein